MPIPILIILYAAVKALVRVITGAVTAGLVYYFLKNTVEPAYDNLISKIMDKVSDLSSVGGVIFDVIGYLDLFNLVSILLAASGACFSLKLMSIAIRAFGINTGS